MQIDQENILACTTHAIETKYKNIFQLFKLVVQQPYALEKLLKFSQKANPEIDRTELALLLEEIIQFPDEVSILLKSFQKLNIEEATVDENELGNKKIIFSEKILSKALGEFQNIRNQIGVDLAIHELIIEIKRWLTLIKLTDEYLTQHRPFFEYRDSNKYISNLSDENLARIFVNLSKRTLGRLSSTSKFFNTKVSGFKNSYPQHYSQLPDIEERDLLPIKNKYYLMPDMKVNEYDVGIPLCKFRNSVVQHSRRLEDLLVLTDHNGEFQTQVLVGHTKFVTAATVLSKIAFASSSEDATIKIWQLNKKLVPTFTENFLEIDEYQCVQTLTDHKDAVTSLTTLMSGELVSVSKDKTIKIWQLMNDQYESVLTINEACDFVFSVPAINGFATSPSERKGDIKLFSKQESGTYSCTQVLTGHTSTVNYLIITPMGFLVTASRDLGYIKLWKLNEGQYECIQTLLEKGNMIIDIVVTKEGDFQSFGWSGWVRSWNFPTLESKLHSYLNHTYLYNKAKRQNDVIEDDYMEEDNTTNVFKKARI